jgi:hypothetical protein
VFIAANYWNATQASWLKTQMADPTPYTFVMRHEPVESSTSGLPGVAASENIVSAYPHTRELLGHTHTYRHPDQQGLYNHVVTGNAGAPFDGGGTFYGGLLVQQQANGNVTATEYDESTGTPNDSWTVTPSGAQAN